MSAMASTQIRQGLEILARLIASKVINERMTKRENTSAVTPLCGGFSEDVSTFKENTSTP